MRTITDFLYYRDVLYRFGSMCVLMLVCIALWCLWVYSPQLVIAGRHPFAEYSARLLVCIACFVLCMLGYGLFVWRKRCVQNAHPGADTPTQNPVIAERNAIAMEHRTVRSFLRTYQQQAHQKILLPRYLLLGAVGSGKSSFIQNAQLDFLLHPTTGQQPIQFDVISQPICDWWLADQAVIVEAPGRYLTQDTNSAVDAAGWQALLQQYQRLGTQSLSGVVLCLSVADLLQHDSEAVVEQARVIRQRLFDIQHTLKSQIPVYLVLTHCDHIPGCTPFFSDLNAVARQQVWGMTLRNDHLQATQDYVSLVSEQMNALQKRIQERVAVRLHSIQTQQQTAQILAFPYHMALLRSVVLRVIQAAFAQHRFAQQPWLRGMYLISSAGNALCKNTVQYGVASHFGLPSVADKTTEQQQYPLFVQRLFKDVLIPEAGLAVGDPARFRRQQVISVVGGAVVLVCTAAIVVLFVHSYTYNKRLISQAQQVVASYRPLPLRQATDQRSYFAVALQRFEVMNRARNIALRQEKTVGWSHRLGLYQGTRLAKTLNSAYKQDLNTHLLPVVTDWFALQLEQASNLPQRLYQLLKVYLMLGHPQYRDRNAQVSVARGYWQELFPLDPALRAAIEMHWQNLLQLGAQSMPLDTARIARARASLRTAELPSLVYSALLLDHANDTHTHAHSTVQLDQYLGLLGDIFVRRSGVSLADPLPYIYTRAAFQQLAAGGVDVLIRRFSAEQWVLGVEPLDPVRRSELAQRVWQLYQYDYIQSWDRLLNDLRLRPARSIEETTLMLAKLTAPSSPLKALIQLVVDQTQHLGHASGSQPTPNDASTSLQGPVASMQVSQAIAGHFDAIARLLVSEGQDNPLSFLESTLDSVRKYLLAQDPSAPITQLDASEPTIRIAMQAVQQAPPPINVWLTPVLGDSQHFMQSKAVMRLQQQQRQAAGSDCAYMVHGRYPFAVRSSKQIPLQDFSALFAPGGRFDQLFQHTLDNGAIAAVSGSFAATARGVLANADAAREIQNGFFPAHSAQPNVAYSLLVRPLRGISRLVVDVDGQRLEARSQQTAQLMAHWPGPQPGLVRLQAWDMSGKLLPVWQFDGPWALFRFLDAGHIRRVGDVRAVAILAREIQQIQIEVIASSLHHPFANTALQKFHCP